MLESCLYVDDTEAAHAFYTQVIGLELFLRDPSRHLFLRCGDGMFLVFDPRVTSRPGGKVPSHGAHGPGHVAFVMEQSTLEAWSQRLASHSVPVETERTWPTGGRPIHLRDPAGNSVELATPQTWRLPEPS